MVSNFLAKYTYKWKQTFPAKTLLYIWALFTSGYNNVGTGVWDYRLSRMCCAAVAPPLRFGRGWGGGPSTVIRLLFTVCLCPLSKHIKKSVKQLNHTA